MGSLEIQTPHLAAFIARRNSGKSHLQKHLLHLLTKAKRFSWVRVVTPTAFTHEWSDIVGEENVRETWDEEEVERLLEHQKECREKGKPNPGLLILDDCLGTVQFQSPILVRLASTGRHFDLSLWMAFQHWGKTPAFIRSNVDLMVVLNPQSEKIVRSLYDEFCPEGFADWRAWKAYVLGATRDYGAVVIGPDRVPHMVRAPAVLPVFRLARPKARRPGRASG
jgi:hypothetical protein